MADNILYIPFLNPIKFFLTDRANLSNFFTKHFDNFMFDERLLAWQEPADYCQPWQTTDIINLQFESTFDPLIVELYNSSDIAVITLPALIGLPNKYYPNTYSFEVSMSLAGLTTGCYYLKITAGTGDAQKFYISNCQYISSTPFTVPNLLIQYSNSRFHEDVIFETGIEFQYRLFGHFGFLKPGRQEEKYKDQKFNPATLSSRSFRQFDLFLGDEYGLPDDVIDLVNRICGCNNIIIDNKSFAIAEGGAFEFTDIQDYPKRGVKLLVEEGINRGSRLFAQDTDVTKKINYGIVVEAKVWGDTSNQGSGNVVPVEAVE
jgi:hypothetical protein